MQKAILWNYKYDDMKESWYKQMQWIVKALQDEGYQVIRTPRFKCKGLENLPLYTQADNPADIVIYNHTDVSVLLGNEVKAKHNWFFKPTIPDAYHTTLDNLGYGSYSSITYNKPPFEKCNMKDVNKFWNTKVKNWIETASSKFYNFKSEEIKIQEKDYYLILGQCGGDYTVTKQDFGSHFYKIEQIAKELLRITNNKIVIKLHPYTDGEFAKNDKFSRGLAEKYSKISPRISVYLGKGNIHEFFKEAKAVIVSNSGGGFEALMNLKPVISFGYPEYHWVTYDLRHLIDLKRALKLDWYNREKIQKFLYYYLEKYCFYDQPSAKRRVRELLNV